VLFLDKSGKSLVGVKGKLYSFILIAFYRVNECVIFVLCQEEFEDTKGVIRIGKST